MNYLVIARRVPEPRPLRWLLLQAVLLLASVDIAAETASIAIPDDALPAAPVLEIGANIKQLTFNWTSVPGATSYRLFQNPDGASGFTPVGRVHAPGTTSTTLDIAVHRHDWVNALYRLEACNTHGCRGSNATSAVNAMVQAIGYFKASNTDAKSVFGGSLALSADGNTLATGAIFEDSAATGVGGNQSDNSALSSGAVYVY